MKADPALRDRFERAAAQIRLGPDRLDEVHGARERRHRARRIGAFAVAAVIGAAAVLVAWQLRFADRSPTPGATPGPTGWIAYLPAYAESRDLFIVDAESGERHVVDIDAGAATVHWGAWSPDGTRLATVLEGPGPRSRIVVSRADGSDPVTLVDDPDTGAVGPDLLNASWSPDGSRIAYSGRVVRGGVARRTIIIVDADGGGRPTVLDGLWVEVSWSPDGESLAMVGFPDAGDEAGQFDLYTVRPDGSGLRQLTDDAVGEHAPSWSPDGLRIVFSHGPDLDQDVFVADADGSGVRNLTDRVGEDLLPVWSPDGAWIAFASDRGATPAQVASNRAGGEEWSGVSIYVMRPDGSQVRRIVDGAEGFVFPTSWAR